jgi:NAD(P)H-flavin reductase
VSSSNRFYKIKDIVDLTENIFKVTLEGPRLEFKSGQHLIISSEDGCEAREYSIYNGENYQDIELLVKEVDGGFFTPQLKRRAIGDYLKIDGPHGRFTIDPLTLDTHKHVMIATGTGIAPIHSFIRTHPKIFSEIYHGVQTKSQAVEYDDFGDIKYTICTSRDETGDFSGRVTDLIKSSFFDKETFFYLCGNSAMVFDVRDILLNKGFLKSNIKSEVYF